MSLCTRNRWTAGTGSSSSTFKNQNQDKNQEAKGNEMEDKLKKMMADRAKQDNLWSTPIIQEESTNQAKQPK
jgi:hypothetical protein